MGGRKPVIYRAGGLYLGGASERRRGLGFGGHAGSGSDGEVLPALRRPARVWPDLHGRGARTDRPAGRVAEPRAMAGALRRRPIGRRAHRDHGRRTRDDRGSPTRQLRLSERREVLETAAPPEERRSGDARQDDGDYPFRSRRRPVGGGGLDHARPTRTNRATVPE